MDDAVDFTTGFNSFNALFSMESPIMDSDLPQSEQSSLTAVEIGTRLFQDGFFVTPQTFSQDAIIFHGHHIGLKIKQCGKLIQFYFPRDSCAAAEANGSGHMPSGELLFLANNELLWQPKRSTDTNTVSPSGYMYGSDRLSMRIDREWIEDMTPTTIQNVASALTLHMRNPRDITIEFSFMPGPYQRQEKRDELLHLLKDHHHHHQSRTTVEHVNIQVLPSLDDRNTAVREYVSLDPMSAEAMKLAANIEARYKYTVGPTAVSRPSIADDRQHRYKMYDSISIYLYI
jgi:hypothetical protein